MNREQRLAELRRRREQALAGGGPERVAKIHAKGCLTARERLELLLDPGSFVEIGTFVTHRAHDFGMDAEAHHRRRRRRRLGHGGRPAGLLLRAGLHRVRRHHERGERQEDLRDHGPRAWTTARPVVGLNDSGGARIQEGVLSLGAYADVFLRNTLASGVVPQISAIMGPCAGGAVYSPAITDFTIMVEGTSHMFVTGPEVIKAVTSEEVSLRGPRRRDDAQHARAASPTSPPATTPTASATCKRLLSFLPAQQRRGPAAARVHRPGRPPRRRARHAGARVARQALRHEGGRAARRGRRRLLRGARALRAATSSSASRA